MSGGKGLSMPGLEAALGIGPEGAGGFGTGASIGVGVGVGLEQWEGLVLGPCRAFLVLSPVVAVSGSMMGRGPEPWLGLEQPEGLQRGWWSEGSRGPGPGPSRGATKGGVKP